jgi:hypothetical protein
MVRSEVSSIKKDLASLRTELASGDLGAAKAKADSISRKAHTAHGLTSGPAWWFAAQLPWVGEPAEVARVLTTQADGFGHDAVPGVLDLADQVSNGGFRTGTTVNLARVRAAQPTVDRASGDAGRALSRVQALPDHTWLPALDRARSSFQDELASINTELANAAQTLRILPDALGATTPKRYFLGFENEAEARGIGGIPGQFAILLAENGKLTFEHFGPDDELRKLGITVDLPADYLAAYGGSGPTEEFADSTLSPHFPYAAQIWAADWEKKSGEHVDGAIAIDPTALSYLLGVTGPATTSDGRTVSAANVVALTQQGVYSLYPDPTLRKVYLVGVAKALADKITAGGDTRKMVTALGKSASQRRLLIWTADPATERFLDSVGYAGTVGSRPGPYTGFAVNNAAGTKLDYYLQRTMTYSRTSCTQNAQSVATLTLHNAAPASGLPTYVTSRSDSAAAGSHPGDNRELVSYLGTAGSKIASVTLDGKPIPVFIGTERGLTLMIADVEMPVGSTRTLQVHVTEPRATQPLQVLQQPLVKPLSTSIDAKTCG